MSKVKFTVIFAAGAVAGAFGMYALNVALARDGGALGGEALVIPLVVLLLWAGYCLGHAKETVAELLDRVLAWVHRGLRRRPGHHGIRQTAPQAADQKAAAQ